MWWGQRATRVFLLLAVCLVGRSLQARASTADDPRQLYEALNAMRVDPGQVYSVQEIHLRRQTVNFSFGEGKLAFLAPLDGRITGAVFTGRGRVIATPREPAERRSLAQFLGVPLLDQPFSRAYLRFTDDTAVELMRQLRDAGVIAMNDPDYAASWDSILAALNPESSLRVMADWLATSPLPCFYAALVGDVVGPFDVLVEPRRDETVLVGQLRTAAGVRYFDVWTSFTPEDAPASPDTFFEPLAYTIDTSIAEDRSLDGKAILHLKATRAGERMITLELSRVLQLERVTNESGQPLVFFQNPYMNRREIAQRGNDLVFVVLPAPAKAGGEVELHLFYHGSVISDAGNGVLFVGARGSWYPHVSGQEHFTPFDLTFRWPRRLVLVATGNKVEEHEEGGMKIGHWQSSEPFALAGFNLGAYASETVGASSPKVELYANVQLEDAIRSRLRAQTNDDVAVLSGGIHGRSRWGVDPRVSPDPVPPRPAAVLNNLGRNVLDSIHFFEKFNGPFPFANLAVSQIPGSFGQGWPGLLYLSTFVFLPPEAQKEVGISQRSSEQFIKLMPYHEVAHQWWGNVIGISSYRDAWIPEAMANYLALLYADGKKPSDHLLRTWLELYRTNLTTKQPGQEEPVESSGPISLGSRLNSSKTPDAYDAVVYGKGTWTIHMLRMMLRDPQAKDPDARFIELLHFLLSRYRYRALSTADFERAVSQFMTPAMDLEGDHSMGWFFDQWVRGTGIPRYGVEFEVRPHGKDFLVRGKLKQSGVPESFTSPVPIYAVRPGSGSVLLGTAVTTGSETSFQFIAAFRPQHLQIDPHLTLLCRTQ